MIKKTIEINLLSDMCCGTGEGNGSHIDMLTAIDECGLPIIPAKRLKGLLRENAELIVAWRSEEKDKETVNKETVNKETVNNVFGGIRGKEANIKISNAEIKNSAKIKKELLSFIQNKDNLITKDAVSDYFTCLRSQTAIGKNGIAKEHSLRTTQTVKKGLSFLFDVTVSDKLSEDEIKLLDDSIKSLRNIGMNKSRGFGEVKCSIIYNKTIGSLSSLKTNIDKPTETVTVPYTITLLQDVVMSSGSNAAPDYISGSMLMGAFAKLTSHMDWFKEVVLKGTIFSNAYIADNCGRFMPTPLGMTAIKNESGKAFSPADGYEKDENKQYVGLGDYSRIEGKKLEKALVDSAFSYHHSTSKSAMGKNVYAVSKILSGQMFKGTITAPKEYIDILKYVTAQNGDCISFGGSASAQYSTCRFEFGQSVTKETTTINGVAVIEFISDVVIVDKLGNNSTNVDDLLCEIKNLISFSGAEIISKNITVGGFNAKWKLPKRQHLAFVKGSAIKLTGCKEQTVDKIARIGLMQNEGYGEIIIRNVRDKNSFDVETGSKEKTLTDCTDASTYIINGIKRSHDLIKAGEYAIKTANSLSNKNSPSSSMRILKAYYSLKDSKDFKEEFTEHCNQHFEQNKELKAFANKAIQEFDSSEFTVEDSDFIDNELFKEFIFSFISQVKRNNQKGDKDE